MATERTQLNTEVESRWKVQVGRDAADFGKTKEIIVNAILRFVFTTMPPSERRKLYREIPYAGLKKKAA